MTRRQRSKIRQTIHDGTPRDRLAKARQKLREVIEDLHQLTARLTELTSHYRRWLERWNGLPATRELPQVDEALAYRARRFRVAAWLVVALEALFASSLATQWLALSRLWATLVGLALSLILTAIADALMGVFDNEEAPRGSYATVKRAALILTLTSFGLLGSVALTRLLPFGGVVIQWASGALAVSLPATAGALLTLASILETGNRLARPWIGGSGEHGETQVLAAEIEALIAELVPASPAAAPVATANDVTLEV
ncbi:MAG TPA: hypothetical protein VF017_23595 [Thermoanaerobaculia bacterium]|nr:hypothetical protein [Thermoanaerobaculia bacterium]